MNQFTRADGWVWVCCAFGSNYVHIVRLQIAYFSWTSIFDHLRRSCSPPPWRLACFHGRAKHPLYILNIRDFPPQPSRKHAHWPWKVVTLMWSAWLLGQNVFCCCADIKHHCSTHMNVHYPDIYFTFIPQQPFHFCLTHSGSDRISGLELILNEMMVGVPAIFKLPSLSSVTPEPPRDHQLWIIAYVVNHLKARLTPY